MGAITGRLTWTLLVRDTQMPRLSKLLAFTLSTYMNADGQCYPGVTSLTSDLCASRRSVQLALRDLEARGLIKTSPRKGTSNIYQATIEGRTIVRTPAHQTTPTREAYVAPGARRTAPKPFNQPSTETLLQTRQERRLLRRPLQPAARTARRIGSDGSNATRSNGSKGIPSRRTRIRPSSLT
jgi:DNA-binding transcriptional MocR family regulator